MDLLVLVTSANKINPSGHVIQVMTDRGNDYLHYKPSTPIGSLDANRIHVLPKNVVIVPPVKKLPKVVNQPFEVNLTKCIVSAQLKISLRWSFVC